MLNQIFSRSAERVFDKFSIGVIPVKSLMIKKIQVLGDLNNQSLKLDIVDTLSFEKARY